MNLYKLLVRGQTQLASEMDHQVSPLLVQLERFLLLKITQIQTKLHRLEHYEILKDTLWAVQESQIILLDILLAQKTIQLLSKDFHIVVESKLTLRVTKILDQLSFLYTTQCLIEI